MNYSTTRVLLVDDDALSRELYGDSLRQAGFAVDTAASASEAASAVGRAPPDVVVTDLLLPDRDGLAVLADAKSRNAELEVIVITALDSVDTAVRAIKSGAADYLVKPVAPEQLRLAVSRCVATRELLHENALLRRNLQLIELGQRLASSLDEGQLLPLAVRSLREALRAQAAVLCLAGNNSTVQPAFWEGLESSRAREIACALPPLAHLSADGHKVVLGGEEYGLLILEEETRLGACILSQPDEDATAWSNARFLARNLSLAIQNLNRLATAEALAQLDDLTKLNNARSMHAAIEREIQRARASGLPFSILFLDLDRFKAVNDTFGHVAGSALIAELGGLLRESVREGDFPARYGGDEYVLLLARTDAAGAFLVGERVRKSIATTRFLVSRGLSVAITATIGVAAFPEHAQDREGLLRAADEAMYRGKASGRNQLVAALPRRPGA